MNTTNESSITELRAQLIEAGRTWSAGQHRVISIIEAIDHSNVWIADGATSAASWVAASSTSRPAPPASGSASDTPSRCCH